jgi:acyl-CoA synthetase (AMP-forming)/AMP-acid ligase II
MYHTYGLNVYSFRLFLARTTLVILPTWDVGLVVETIAKSAAISLIGCLHLANFAPIPRWRVSTIGLVPSMVYQLANYPGIAKADFSSLERVNSGGAYLAPEVAETFLRIVPQGATMMEG